MNDFDNEWHPDTHELFNEKSRLSKGALYVSNDTINKSKPFRRYLLILGEGSMGKDLSLRVRKYTEGSISITPTCMEGDMNPYFILKDYTFVKFS